MCFPGDGSLAFNTYKLMLYIYKSNFLEKKFISYSSFRIMFPYNTLRCIIMPPDNLVFFYKGKQLL